MSGEAVRRRTSPAEVEKNALFWRICVIFQPFLSTEAILFLRVANMAKAHASSVNFHTQNSKRNFGGGLVGTIQATSILDYSFINSTVNQLSLQGHQLLSGTA